MCTCMMLPPLLMMHLRICIPDLWLGNLLQLSTEVSVSFFPEIEDQRHKSHICFCLSVLLYCCCCFVPFVHSSDPSVKLAVPSVGQSVRLVCPIQPSISTVWLAGRSLSSGLCIHCTSTIHYTYRSTTDDVGWGC